MFFIIIHQDVLQKNFIALANIIPFKETQSLDWLEELIRSCLVAANNGKETYCIIEHKDSLSTLISAQLSLHANVQKNLLTMIFESSMLQAPNMLLLNSQGQIMGINANWQTLPDEDWFSGDLKILPIWQQEALFFTKKTDATFFSICPITRTFLIIVQGKLFTNISAHHALLAIKKYLSSQNIGLKEEKGAVHYGYINQKQSAEQRNH
jgi:hypothetical protein